MQENKNSRIFTNYCEIPFSKRIGQGFVFAMAIVFFWGVYTNTFAQGSGRQNTLAELCIKNKFVASCVGVQIKDVENDSIVADLNQDSMYNPASVCKLLTASMAFEKLGTRYFFKTSVYTDAPPETKSKSCPGNVYIRGGGDPSLVIERFWLFIQQLKCIGVTSFEKDIVLDNSFFDSVETGPCFYETTADDPYMVPISSLSANFNSTSVWITPANILNEPANVDVLPKSKNILVTGSVITSAKGASPTWAISTRPEGEKTRIHVSGAIALGAEPVVEYRKVWQTTAYFEGILRSLLEENNITLKGSIKKGIVPDSLLTQPAFYVFPSIPLCEVLTDMMKYSLNYAAEMVFKTLAQQKDSTYGSWPKAAELAMQWWKDRKLPGQPSIKNGSGMGDCNRMSCSQINSLLQYVYHQKQYLPEFLNAMPVAGVDGTVKSRFKKTRFKGIIRAKTGTLNDFGISSIAGYVLFPKKTYVFTIIINGCRNKKQYSMWEMQEKILEAMVPRE
jgi:D-alanyl-D-alanine carboxypeptidase/D-alanyl-D-alanine-endopeptidase (penicillin-binding protein 4)